MFPFFFSCMEITLHCWEASFHGSSIIKPSWKMYQRQFNKTSIYFFQKWKYTKNNSSTISNAKTQSNKALTKTTQIDIFFPPRNTCSYSVSKSWRVFLQHQNPHTSHLLSFPGNSRGVEAKLRRNSPPIHSPYPYSQGSLEEMPPAHVED